MINPYWQILLLLPVALLIAAWMYDFFKSGSERRLLWLPFIFRSIALWALLALISNPGIEKKTVKTLKPGLSVLIDRSRSMKETGGDHQVSETLNIIKGDAKLNEKFNIHYFGFGEELYTIDSTGFNAQTTDIGAALTSAVKITGKHPNPILLISDGRSTQGADYPYVQKQQPVYAIIAGDTTRYADISIHRVNVNPYVYVKNRFPVEIFLSYTGDIPVESRIVIKENDREIISKRITLSKEKTAGYIRVMLPAGSPGVHHYAVMATPVKDEKNLRNNRKFFSVEVIDERSKILIVSGIIHPDIGALKRSLEHNEQREVQLVTPDKLPSDIHSYDQVILYQPGRDFQGIFDLIEREHINSFIITGSHTDWKSLNTRQQAFSRKINGQDEEYQAVYNSGFSGFVITDPGFDDLPPLRDAFGSLEFNVPYKTLLFQRVSGITSESPLLAIYEEGKSKHAVLFGEGFWRWRLQYLASHPGQTEFEDFWITLFRYLQPEKKLRRYDLQFEKSLSKKELQPVRIRYFDENFTPVTGLSPVIRLQSPNGKSQQIPMAPNGDAYIAEISGLNPGIYGITISAGAAFPLAKGSFRVQNYSLEQQFVTADVDKLRQLASYTGGKTARNVQSLLPEILKDERYNAILKVQKRKIPLIDWHWLLALIVVSLSIEWFIRKYKGMI